MKILFFLAEFPKLSETFVLNQITGFIEQGHDVTILARDGEINNKIHNDVHKYNLFNKTIYYGSTKEEKRINRFLKFLKLTFDHLLKKLIIKSYNGKIKLRDILKHRDLIHLINLCNKRKENFEFDIILAHFGPNGLVAEKLIKSGILKGNLYTIFHGNDMLAYIQAKGENVYTDLFHSQSTLLPISNHWKEKLISLGANFKNIHVHHMGIDLNKFEFSPVIPTNEIKVLSVARFVEKKGLKFGISAVENLINENYNIHYSIVGGGPLEKDLKNIISNQKLEKNIQLLGWKTQDEIIELIKESHIILLPSVTGSDGDMEGIPVLLMEAMAMGKMVISTYHSGIPELITNKVNGFLVEEKDVNGLSQIIRDLVEDTSIWEDISNNARETIDKDFNINVLNKELLKLFHDDLK